MYCNNCFEEIPDGSATCPKCHAQLTNISKGKKKVRGFSFGGSKKKNKKSNGPLFDEEGNMIGSVDISSDISRSLDSDVGIGENRDTNNIGGPPRGGRRSNKRDFRLNPIIVIILAVSVIAIIGIIVFTVKFMKHHGEDVASNGTSGNTVVASDTGNSTQDNSGDNGTSPSEGTSASTSKDAEVNNEVNSGNNQAAQQGQTRGAAGNQSTEKSSFTQDTADSYFWPDSDSRLYTFEDLEKLNLDQVKLIKAEIYAREGCIFKNQEYNNYFKKKNWYNGTIDEKKFDPGRLLNYYELENARMIDTYIDNKR